MNIDKKVAQLVAVRDIIKAIEEKHTRELSEWKVRLEKLRGEIQQFMSDNGLKNLRTPSGSCYTSQKSTASLADPEAFMAYVIKTGNFDLLDRRANATAVKDFVKAHKTLPPGCNLNTIETLGVTRSSGSQE